MLNFKIQSQLDTYAVNLLIEKNSGGTNMQFKQILISKLRINAANDRHGTLKDESSAIAWLFNNKEQHMKGLAMDIVAKGEIFEPPLIVKQGEKYDIYDGNRRTTCLKLLKNPKKAPTVELQKYFKKLQGQWDGEFPKKIMCRLENNPERVDDILFRRHTGTQNGVGQTTWDDRMKRNFVERTGRGRGRTIADEIEALLEKHNKLPSHRDIPRSTMNRLLSSEEFRSRVGIRFLKGKLSFTHNEAVVSLTLQRIAHDLASRKVVLGDLWKAKGKHGYLDSLEEQGMLPKDGDLLPVNIPDGPNPKPSPNPTPNPPTPSPTPRPKPAPSKQIHLIPSVDYGINWKGQQTRQKDIWEELQFHLILEQHPNAISVLLRVLIELSVKSYIQETKLQNIHKDDSLANKINKIADDLLKKKLIEKDYKKSLKKIEQVENLISVNTLNRYIHYYDLSPSPTHLKAIWDSLSTFVVLCLKA